MAENPSQFYASLKTKEKVNKSRKQRGGRTLVSTKAGKAAFKELRGKIHLDVVEARNLAKADIIGKSDPYAICQTTTGAPRFKTKIIKKTLNPVWKESNTFQVFIDGELMITVWDWDLVGKDDFLGVLTIPFQDIVDGKWADGKWSQFTIETTEKSKKKPPGEIFLKITWESDKKVEVLAPANDAPKLVLSIPRLKDMPHKVSHRDLTLFLSPRSPQQATIEGGGEGSPLSSPRRSQKPKDDAPAPLASPRRQQKEKVDKDSPLSSPRHRHKKEEAGHPPKDSPKESPKEVPKNGSPDKGDKPTEVMLSPKKPSIPTLSGFAIKGGPTPPPAAAPAEEKPKEDDKDKEHKHHRKESSGSSSTAKPKPSLSVSRPGGMKLNLSTVPEKGVVVGNEETAEEEKPKEAAKPMSLNLSLATKGLSGDQPKRAESYHPGQVTERLSSDGDFGIRYEFKETLGEGAFAVVKRAINRVTKEAVAVKIANKTGHWTENTARRFKQEIEIIYGLDYPYVVSVKDIDETLQNVYIVMELVTGGDLFHAIVKADCLPEPIASKAIREILLGLEYVHDNKIIHRDMKCENVLLSEHGRSKIADFGVSTYVKEGELLTEWAGTMLYMAPEQLNGKGYSYSIDLWATGVIAYNALSGTHPFDGGNNASLLQSLSESKIDFPSEDWGDISKEAKDFVSKLIEPDASKRYTVAKAMDHPFITKHHKRAQKEEKEKEKDEKKDDKKK